MRGILVTKSLTKFFGGFKAVDNVNLTLHEGTVTSIVGPNGAGKTTLLNMISGVVKPSSGRIYFMGRDITGLPVHKIVRMGIARGFQIPCVCSNLTTLDNVRVAVLSRMGKLCNMFKLVDGDGEVYSKATEILKTFGLYDKRDLLARDLSHGDRKLLDIAMAFALEPKLILLDEPTSGVSSSEKNRIMKTVEKVIREKGITALIVEHDMDIVFSYSDRIIVMYDGKIIADGEPEEIMSDRRIESLLLGCERL